MPSVGLGVTIGSHSLRAVKLRRKGEGFVVQRVFSDRVDDSTRPVAGRALAARGFKGTDATLGLTGRDVIIRYTQVPPVPDWRLRNLMKFEVEEVSSQSGGDVSADYRKLNLPDPEAERDDDTILVALARNRHLDKQIRSLDAGGIKLGGGCPNSVALFNAFAVNATYTEDETALLVNIGSDNVDIAIQEGGELLFARNATPGGLAFTEAVKTAFGTTDSKAEKMKRTKGDVTPKGEARYPDPTSEKVANAMMGVAGQMSSMIQSTLMIAKAQTRLPELKIDRVLLSGGGASLKGLDKYLKQAMGVPVERFNPFDICDLSQLGDDEAKMIEDAPHEFAVAVGLAQTSLAPAAFELSVLPAALKRTRDFLKKGIYSVAAALVMAGVLVLMYMGRSEASQKANDDLRKISRKLKEADRKDEQLRKVLKVAQEEEVKHRLLAQRVAPGVLLSNVFAELENNLKDSKAQDIYIKEIDLRVREETNAFQYYKPLQEKKNATGYKATTRTRYQKRDATVRVLGRIGGRNAAQLYQDFYQACLNNKRGLVVEAPEGLRPGRGGRASEFELLFRPGHSLQLEQESGQPLEIVMRDLKLDDPEDPTKFVGRRADGVPIEIEIEKVDRSQRRRLLEDLQSAAKPAEGN